MIIVLPKPDAEIDRTLLEIDNWGGPWPSNLLLRRNRIWIFDPQPYEINLGKSIGTRFEGNRLCGRIAGKVKGLRTSSCKPDLDGKLPFHPDFPDTLRDRVRQRLEAGRE